MMKLLIAATLIVAVSAIPTLRVGSRTFTSEDEALFQRFKSEHGKVYFDQHDEAFRKSIFLNNLNMIRTHNAEAEEGKHTFTMAMNEFGDLTFEEFHAKYTGFHGLRSRYIRSQNTANLAHVKAANDVDWSKNGAVTPIKNQGQCGSCWAFSATGGIEGAWYIAKGTLVSLSEQQLMDCSKAEGNNSCEGGLMDYAFEWVIKNGGICSEADYPYEEKDNTRCQTSCTSVASITSYKDVGHTDDALATAITQQPVSVAIEADQQSFQFYSSGVLTKACGDNLDHGVLAVGFGTLDGTDYWKVKNSWGASWGMEGYILLEKGGNAPSSGQCGILLSASYPIV